MMLRADFGSFIRTYPGEIHGGDFVQYTQNEDQIGAVLLDVAGHGDRAFRVGESLLSSGELPTEVIQRQPAMLMHRLHAQLQGSRGACIGLFHIDLSRRRGRFFGVGTIDLRSVGGSRGSYTLQDGLLGHQLGRIHTQDIEIHDDSTFILHSDGVRRSLNVEPLMSQVGTEPQRLAREVIRCGGRNHDDASCLVIRIRMEPESS